MKLLHLADLHLGKRVNGFSMMEDQDYILRKILNIIDDEHPDVVLIAGDVYDRSVPPEEAVDLFDDFLVELSNRNLNIYIISGNHDSAERIAFGGRLMDRRGVHPSPVYNGRITPLYLEDEYGPVAFYLIPFIKPVHVRSIYRDEEIKTYTDAMAVAIQHLSIDSSIRNVALVHQFVAGAEICDSEEHSVGGIDQVEASIFDGFDYVALGHLHRPQHISRNTIRYAGSPLKYSFSEAGHKKSITMVDLREKGDVDIHTIPLVSRRDLKQIRGTFPELTAEDYLNALNRDDYFEITLTDEEDIPNALTKLRDFYPNLMVMKYDNRRTRTQAEISVGTNMEQKAPLELFSELYEQQNGQPMSDVQREFTSSLIEEIWNER